MSRRPEGWLPVLARLWPITWKSAKLVHDLAPLPLLGKVAKAVATPMFTGDNLNVSYVKVD